MTYPIWLLEHKQRFVFLRFQNVLIFTKSAIEKLAQYHYSGVISCIVMMI